METLAGEGLMPRRVTARHDPEQEQHWAGWLVALDAEIAAEDREDRRARALANGSSRVGFVAFDGFGEVGVVARDGVSKR